MADLVRSIQSVVIALQAKRSGVLYQPARIRAVLEDGSFLVSVNGRPPVRHVAEGDPAPFWAGDRVWVSNTSGDPVIHGKRVAE